LCLPKQEGDRGTNKKRDKKLTEINAEKSYDLIVLLQAEFAAILAR